jgi:hypothetical protein
MTAKIQVKDSVASTTLYMWEVDAEEAIRYHPARYSVVSGRVPPSKNPGGRGF